MRLGSLIVALFLAPLAFGQVIAPPPPKTYHVEIRYSIQADRDGRVRVFRAMSAELAALDFKADDREDADLDILDPSADRLSGTIPSANAEKLLKVTAVQTVLAWPEGKSLPTDISKPVQLSLKLATGLDAETQRLLFEQSITQLEKLGFRNAMGYDDRSFTRVRGAVPAGQVITLLKDLRGLPAGWLLQQTPREKLPSPLRDVLPVRFIEVLPDLDVPPLAPPLPAASPKYSQDLRAYLADPANANKPLRVEASFNQPLGDQREYRVYLKAKQPGTLLEGVVDTLVTFLVNTPKDLETLATEPSILSLRLPPSAASIVVPANDASALKSANLIELHHRGYRGAGRRLVILAGAFDFARVPKGASYLDLTPELSPTIEASPINPAFDGTAAAIAARAAAPDAEIILVRIEPSAFHQLFTVARATLGDFTLSTAQVSRAEWLLNAYEDMNRRRDYVNREYTDAMTDLRDDDRPAERRKKAKADLEAFRVEEAAFLVKYNRMIALRKGLEALSGATAIASTLTWDDGYPADGFSEFARFLESRFTPITKKNAPAPTTPTWVQAASESTWSVWAGPALDRDNNDFMEFADANVPVPRGLWNRQLNFLGALQGDQWSPTLTAGAKMRITIQWREPHDPNAMLTAEPLIGFTLHLLRQYDPDGKTVATDEFAEVARSEGAPVRVMKTAAAGVYEQTLEVTVPSDGRYALQVSMLAGSASRFAAVTRLAEISPKIVLKSSDAKSRFIFSTFVAPRPGVGVPGDSSLAFTVGRCDNQGRSLSLLGAGPGLQLRAKPDALLFSDSAGSAAGTMAGLAADLAPVGVRPAQFVGTQAIGANGVFALPQQWLQMLPAPRQ